MIYNIIRISGRRRRKKKQIVLYCLGTANKQNTTTRPPRVSHKLENGSELCRRSTCLWMRWFPVGLCVHVRRGFTLLSHVALQVSSRSSSCSSNIPQCRPADFITLLPDSRSDCVRPCESFDWKSKRFPFTPSNSRLHVPPGRLHHWPESTMDRLLLLLLARVKVWTYFVFFLMFLFFYCLTSFASCQTMAM